MDSKKKRTIYIAILVSLTVIVCTAAVAIRIGLFGKKILNTLDHSLSGASVNETVVLSDPISTINIDAEIGEFIIETGEAYSVSYDFPKELEPQITNKNGNLKIVIKGNKKANSMINMTKHSLIITIPEDASLGDIAIEVNAGSVEIENIKAGGLNVITDAGSLDIRKCTLGDCDIETAAGSVDIRDCTLGNCDIETDAGSIDFRNCEANDCEMVTNMGSIAIKNSNIANGEFAVDLGSLEVIGNFESLSATCSLGSIDIKSDNIEGKKMELETDLGSITVNGSSKGSSFSQ